MSDSSIADRFERWLAEGQNILADLKAGGAQSAPAERRTYDPNELLTVKQAAHLVPCHVRTIQRRIEEEPDFSVTAGGKRFVLRSELHRASRRGANCQTLSVAAPSDHVQSPGHKNQEEIRDA